MKKIYLAAAGILFALLLIGSPILYFADRAGVYEVKNLGNVTSEAEYYDGTPIDGVLNGLVDMKNSLTALYTNCLPGYYETVLTYSQAEDALNQPFTTLYSHARSNAAAQNQSTVPAESAVDTLEAPETAEEPVSEPVVEPATEPAQEPAEEPAAEPVEESAAEPAEEPAVEPVEEPAAEPAAPETAADSQKVVSVSSEFIGADNVHRHYWVDVEFGDGMKSSFLDTAVVLSDVQKESRVKVQARKLNRIADCNTDVNFYFMMFTRMQDTDFFEDVIVGEDSTKEYADLFFSLLSDNITAQRWEMNSVRDRVENVYLTDHHWNTYGSYLGFCQICKMICPDFTPVELGEPIDFPKSRFYGSFARSCMTLDLWDVFRVYDYDLGPYTCSPKWKFELQEKVLSKAEYTTPDKNIYAIFFPEVYEVHYTENQTGRNLLVLGDSYTQGFVELLASAFDNTYAYYYGNYSGLHYDTFIKEHNITDVLFEQFSDRILFDLYGDDKLANIKTD